MSARLELAEEPAQILRASPECLRRAAKDPEFPMPPANSGSPPLRWRPRRWSAFSGRPQNIRHTVRTETRLARVPSSQVIAGTQASVSLRKRRATGDNPLHVERPCEHRRGRTAQSPSILRYRSAHQRTSPFRTKKCAPHACFSHIDGVNVGRRRTSILTDQRSFPASGSWIWSPHFGHCKCAHFRCPSRTSTISSEAASFSASGRSGTNAANHWGRRRRRSRKNHSTTGSGVWRITSDSGPVEAPDALRAVTARASKAS